MEGHPLRGILALLIGTVVGMAVFIAFGQGAYLTCSAERGSSADCYLKKRTLLAAKEHKFSRNDILSVDLTVSTVTAQRSKSSKEHWGIRLKSGGELPVTLHGVAWQRGNMNLKSLRDLLLPGGASPVHSISLVAYGIEAWFFGFLPAAIGWALALVSLARPVNNLTTDALRRARTANLTMLLVVSGVTIAGWLVFFRLWENFLAG